MQTLSSLYGHEQTVSIVFIFFVALFVLSLCPFDISAGVGAFVIGLSQISSSFLLSALTLTGFLYCISLYLLKK